MAKKASKRTVRLKNLTKGQLGELALATSHALAEYQATRFCSSSSSAPFSSCCSPGRTAPPSS